MIFRAVRTSNVNHGFVLDLFDDGTERTNQHQRLFPPDGAPIENGLIREPALQYFLIRSDFLNVFRPSGAVPKPF